MYRPYPGISGGVRIDTKVTTLGRSDNSLCWKLLFYFLPDINSVSPGGSFYVMDFVFSLFGLPWVSGF